MHSVASCLFGGSKSVRKMRSPQMLGDDSPDATAVFQRTLWLGLKWTGGLPAPSPEEFGPRNWGHHALPAVCPKPAMLDRTKVDKRAIEESRVMIETPIGTTPKCTFRR